MTEVEAKIDAIAAAWEKELMESASSDVSPLIFPSHPASLILESPRPATPEWAAFAAGVRRGDVILLGKARDAWRVVRSAGTEVELERT